MRTVRPVAPWLMVVLVAAVFAGCWVLTYTAGGTRTAMPHIFYVPIVLAARPFGVRGGIVAGVIAAVLCGPGMPLDVGTGEPQELLNWATRGAFFVLVGALAGTSTMFARRRFQNELASQLWTEVNASAGHSADASTMDGWGSRVRDALESHSFRTVFQPIYRCDGGDLIAVEALTRFDDLPVCPPDEWFARAADVGLGIELELAALDAALTASTDLPAAVALAFNASPALLSDPRLTALLDQHPGRALIAEVTEHAIVDDYHHLARAIAGLRARGVRIAVDDAGAGFASLRHVVRLQPDIIKLDLSLTQNLDDDPVLRPLADCLIQFAHRTDSVIVVEGIETARDLHTWKHLGADAVQGFFLARPGPLPADLRSQAVAGAPFRMPAR